jgi:hypothetical protein
MTTTTEERYRQAIDSELAEFEKREREICGAGTARKERLGSVHFGVRKETANWLSQNRDKSYEGSQAGVCDPLADPARGRSMCAN